MRRQRTQKLAMLGSALSLLVASATAASLPNLKGMVSADELSTILGHVGPQPPKLIAVVGSSGNLLFRGRGPEIDAHDVVIRVNGATTAGYEHDVGAARKQRTFVLCWRQGCDRTDSRSAPSTCTSSRRSGARTGGTTRTCRWQQSGGDRGPEQMLCFGLWG